MWRYSIFKLREINTFEFWIIVFNSFKSFYFILLLLSEAKKIKWDFRMKNICFISIRKQARVPFVDFKGSSIESKNDDKRKIRFF